MQIDFPWFDDCPNHEQARQLLGEVLSSLHVEEKVNEIDATMPKVAQQVHFPGSPTLRVNGVDEEPDFVDPGDYTPRSRLYSTAAGLRGVRERSWIFQVLSAHED